MSQEQQAAPSKGPGGGGEKRPIIIKKIIKKSHGGHHGGQWKVAYADFVTAMMAFFMLMWLLNAVSSKTLQGVADYFMPAVGIAGQNGSGLNGGTNPSVKDGLSSTKVKPKIKSHSTGTTKADQQMSDSDQNAEQEKFISIMNNLEEAIQGSAELKQFAENVMIDITPEGLRIQVMDTVNRAIFEHGSDRLQDFVKKILNVVGGMIKTLPNYLAVEGYTTPVDISGTQVDQWILSGARANAARLYLNNGIVPNEQVIRLVAKADREPFNPKDPSDPKNTRISIILLNANSVSKYQQGLPGSAQ